jgi:hypothetical protein
MNKDKKAAKQSKTRAPKKLGLVLADLNANERTIVEVLASDNKRLTLADMTALLEPRARSEARANSWARNAIRRPLREGMLRKVRPGVYAAGPRLRSGKAI